MSQLEIIPLVEKLYPVKLFVKTLVWSYCKIARLNIFKNSTGDRVVVISLHRIGDSIFTTHAIKKIVEFYKDKSISIICFPETKVIFQMVFPSVEILTIPHTFFWHGRIATREAKSILHGANAEIIYDLTGAITSATLIASTSAKKIIGMNLEYFVPLYDYYTPIRTKPHLIDTYLDVVKLIIPVENDFSFEFPIVASETNKILIHPHAGWKAKEWGINKFCELAQRLSSQYEVEFITEVDSLSKDNKKVICENFRLIETKSVEDLIDNIRNCSVVIGNDSGPIHIASYLGRSTFAVYGPTNPKYCKPFGIHHSTIRQELSCSSVNQNYCFTDAGRKCPSIDCMKLLPVETVYQEVCAFLKRVGMNS